jgi:acylphosphatase
VEATVSGTEKQVQEFIAWCRQGPPKAVVTGVDVQDVPDEFFTGFSVKRDWF